MRNRAGFSLVELMVTILILGLIAAFSLPAFNRYLTGWNLRNAHGMVISEMKLLRQRAITRGQSLHVWFSPGSDIYWFQNPKTLVWTSYRLPNRVTFETVTFVGGPYDTYMEPDGRSRRAGSVILRASNNTRDTVVVDLSGWVGRP